MFRRACVLAVFTATLLIPASTAAAAPCWRPPVSGFVTDPFRTPSCPYCAGNRGLEYRVGANAQVRAVAAGTVSWAGSIAGTRYVVVRHSSGWRTTYGKLASTPLEQGDRVVSGAVIGRADRSFYFGLRIGDDYIDPAPLLGRLVGRARLIPVDGSTARRSPPPRLRCAN